MHRGVLADLGRHLQGDERILDFGCGAGGVVAAWRAEGFDARGCDFEVPDAPGLAAIEQPYRLPYDDGSFDLVASDQVFEHVMDYEAALAETRRVLRSGGIAVHMFPARWRPIEGHVFVPIGGRFAPRWWLRVWAIAGVRNDFQKGMDAAEVVERNASFLSTSTNYLRTGEIERIARRHFSGVTWAEGAMLRNTYGRARILPRVLGSGAAVAGAVRHLHTRVLVTRP